MLPWLLPLVLVALVVAVAFGPGWVIGLIAAVGLVASGYGGVVWYYRRYRQVHGPDDHK